MGSFQTPITIAQAIERIKRNEYLLPVFQREFKWGPDRIEHLFDSLMLGYPFSSMLFWKVKGDMKASFRFYKFLDAYIEQQKTHNELMPTQGIHDFHAVLDGQQRLTSLFIGLCGSYAYHEYRRSWTYSEWTYPTRHLYLNVTSTYTDEESDQKYKFAFLNKADTEEADLYEDDNDEQWFRAGKILDLHHSDDFGIDEFVEEYGLVRDSKKMLQRLDKVIFTVSSINYYEEEETAPDKAVNIFVRINSGGMPLDFSDILMSIATATWKKEDARGEIYGLVDTVKALDFTIDKNYVLKAFLYLYHRDVRFRVVSFNNNFITTIEQNWKEIRNAIISLFEVLKTFGLNHYTLTSNNATLPVLYYMYHKNIYTNFATKTAYKKDREIIRKWLFASIIRRVFGSSADSVLTQTRRAFTADMEKQKTGEFALFPIKEINREIRRLGDVGDDFIEELLWTQKDSRYAFSILALLYPDMDYKNNNFNQDHMHPAASYEDIPQEAKDELGWECYNSILNLQMLDANENKSKQDKPLKAWVDQETLNCDKKRFMESHIIPQDVSLELSSFSEFIARRKDLLLSKMKELLN
ncbi:MAG: DUF262 domain-containing protein [Treponema sp.]|jgi:uncharacterized protein with ParB-like and HNH nuclease domain|nr:DUF262 domain-containing protein [Treponema sp.]